ncbi:MarR family winged helix-turn-helix transcriptional regulator [Denitratisoma oestradiolicum]|uniref:MarR family transcriptional regulator n=1 Tax=Denitratisoma oestradiolicum TaxID=311182 RepID=A0A6S6Y6U1_9PROT|nr:MarR family transcriptional regulator [Denitratisoma oestradiolicum]TWO79236.1 MarR family transcriptional regulator [Denitratisoma oestradiolicum]CAB1368238.1 MarR family transcriptional regulator [Denitratisoma oestradiolicum]
MPQKSFLPLVRELAECFQAFEAFSAGHIRSLGLTPSQFDIIATLGNTEGMSCKELGQKTLMTKGTLTGVLDRLEARGLVVRQTSSTDGRSWVIQLTRSGQKLFERIFPAHLEHMGTIFTGFSDAQMATLRRQLAQLKKSFRASLEVGEGETS